MATPTPRAIREGDIVVTAVAGHYHIGRARADWSETPICTSRDRSEALGWALTVAGTRHRVFLYAGPSSPTPILVTRVGPAELGRWSHVVKRMPTQLGDVLILSTDHSFTLHAVGQITKDGQQDFDTHENVKYPSDRDTALADAKALVAPGRRIFFRNLDTGEWSELSN